MHVILTERHQITRHPLVSICSSLCCNSCEFHWSTESDLQPLIGVSNTGDPGPHEATGTRAMESSEEWTVVDVIRRRGGHGSVFDLTALNANWNGARSSWMKIEFIQRKIKRTWTNNYKMTDGKIPMSCVPLKPILEKEGDLNYKGINIFAPVSIIVRDKI